MTRPAVHFIGFRGEEYWSAVKVWGPPGFIHMGWDRRALRDIHPDDTVIFAKGTEKDPFRVNPKTGRETTFSDLIEKEH
jgi:hypothetical protein